MDDPCFSVSWNNNWIQIPGRCAWQRLIALQFVVTNLKNGLQSNAKLDLPDACGFLQRLKLSS